MTAIGDTCGMCEERVLIPAPTKEGSTAAFAICPNCDDPLGKMPEGKSEFK